MCLFWYKWRHSSQDTVLVLIFIVWFTKLLRIEKFNLHWVSHFFPAMISIDLGSNFRKLLAMMIDKMCVLNARLCTLFPLGVFQASKQPCKNDKPYRTSPWPYFHLHQDEHILKLLDKWVFSCSIRTSCLSFNPTRLIHYTICSHSLKFQSLCLGHMKSLEPIHEGVLWLRSFEKSFSNSLSI